MSHPTFIILIKLCTNHQGISCNAIQFLTNTSYKCMEWVKSLITDLPSNWITSLRVLYPLLVSIIGVNEVVLHSFDIITIQYNMNMRTWAFHYSCNSLYHYEYFFWMLIYVYGLRLTHTVHQYRFPYHLPNQLDNVNRVELGVLWHWTPRVVQIDSHVVQIFIDSTPPIWINSWSWRRLQP